MLDTQELIKTWNDPNSGLWDRGLAIGSVALDLVGIGAEVKGIVGAAKVGAKATEALGKILGVTTKAGETGKIGSEAGKVVTKVGGEAGKATHVEKTITEADKVGDTGHTLSRDTGEGSNGLLRTTSSVSLNSSDTLRGTQAASQELIDAVSKKRDVVIAQEGSEGMRYLNWIGAAGNVGGPTMKHILLKPNPSKITLLEEFLHGTQHRLGIIKDLGSSGMGSAETHVKDFMIRHNRLLGLNEKDVDILKQLRDKGL